MLFVSDWSLQVRNYVVHHAIFGVLTAVSFRISVLWDVALCRRVTVPRSYGVS